MNEDYEPQEYDRDPEDFYSQEDEWDDYDPRDPYDIEYDF